MSLSTARRATTELAFAPAVLLLLVAGPLGAQAMQDEDWKLLQGTWIVAAAEQDGKPFDVIKGGKLVITGQRFDLATASGNRFSGELAIDAAANPKHLDFHLSNGETWLAIYSASDVQLRLNYVAATDGARPTQFATASGQPGTVIALRKSD